jgi:exodeoxyribonuclease V gamma subunit
LRLWLELLLASAAGLAPPKAVLVGRDKQRFRALEQIAAPSAAEAAELLLQLRQWRRKHQRICWPVPPDTGWAFAAAEQRRAGQGWGKARAAWEGGFGATAERRDPVQALCFGSDLPLEALLTPATEQRALALHSPLLQRWEERKR